MPYRSTNPDTIERRKQVAERIRTLRLYRNLTQERLGERYGVDRRAIIDIESGRHGITLDALFDIADALGVPVTRLLVDSGSTTDGGGAEGG